MSKSIVFLLCIVVCTLAAEPFDKIKEIIQRDECTTTGMKAIRPELHKRIKEVKNVTLSLSLEP